LLLLLLLGCVELDNVLGEEILHGLFFFEHFIFKNFNFGFQFYIFFSVGICLLSGFDLCPGSSECWNPSWGWE
jgi:hypothetical protein